MMYLISTLFVPVCAFLSRACGGGFPKAFPAKLAEVVFGLFMGIPLVLAGHYLLAAIAAVAGIAFKITGHGQYMDLGHYKKKSDRKQFVDPLVSLFFGPDPNWTQDGVGNKWRDLFGLTITGTGVGIVAGLALISIGQILEGLVIILTCSLKGVAYLIGWSLVAPENHPTATGEYLTGAFVGIGLGICVSGVL